MNMAIVVTFLDRIDIDRFVTAFEQVVLASDVLRTQVRSADDLMIASGVPAQTERVQIDQGTVDQWASEIARRPIDLSKSCYHSAIAEHGDATSWCISTHHLAIDATSYGLLVERVVAAYTGETPPASDFYRWVSAIRSDPEAHAKQSSHWHNRAAPPRPGRVYLATDRTAPAAGRSTLALTSNDHLQLAEALTSRYRLLSPELSLAAVLVSTTAVYLHRLSGAHEFAIGVPVHHRNHPDAAELIGPTLAVYPVDIALTASDTFATLHRRVARQLMTTLGNAHPAIAAPGEYDAVVNVIPNVAPRSRADVKMTTRWIHPGEIDPEHMLRVQATRYGRTDDTDERIDLDLDLQDQVADPTQRKNAPEHYANVLRSLVGNPDDSIYAASLLTDDEVTEIRPAEIGPDAASEPEPLIERLRRALAGSQSVAIRSGDETVTGDELWTWAHAVAADLYATTPASARVGIELEPSAEAVAAILGCLLAGRSFVPLDPAQPASRKHELSRRAALARVFTSPQQVRSTRDLDRGEVPPVEGPADAEAYLLFTSGSSGIPKGVPISNEGLTRYIQFATDSYFPEGLVPVAPLFSALTFDLTITTLFAPLVQGGELVILGATGASAIAAIAERTDLNWCKATPSHLEVFTSLTDTTSLEVLVVGGEAFRSDLAERLWERNQSLAIFNEYGPTEAVVGCMIHRVDPVTNRKQSAVPIGRPAPGVELRIVDPGGKRLPTGTPGELLIAHRGLTAGYLDQDNDAPFTELDGVRFYRSGDLVVRDDDQIMTYLGRIDEQIKVGGIRLDPAEVEHALVQHPAIATAAVRLWSPTTKPADQHCVRCGLASNVPNVHFDDNGVCSTCHAFDKVAPVAQSWFRTEHNLTVELRALNEDNDSDYDCVALLSGGKDSTYALYRLVDLGFKPYAITLDNGFISEAALENCRQAVADLGIDHEFVTTPQMNAIFRDSLATHSDVCHGCYKTIYTLATNRAVELGVPAIVTGLSRGQLFETRLIPGQFQQERFDPDAIDRAVVEARKRYHRAPDFPNRVLDTAVFETDEVFESLKYIDIYRYLDVELDEVLTYLAEQTPWKRPPDTGRSSNCLINIAGIHAHQVEQGYHNYAEPYAWDVRLGHKQRAEAMAELEDPIEPDEIADMLATVGYQPAPKQILTTWFQTEAGQRPPTPTELRNFLSERLPRHAIPTAFVHVSDLATTVNGKLDEQALQAPEREHRAAIGAQLEPASDLEVAIVGVWEDLLGIAPISVGDDFFALGGDSLAAVTMIVSLGETLGSVVREELAFIHSTPRQLAQAIESSTETLAPVRDGTEPHAQRKATAAPALSAGELSLLFHQQSRPDDLMYNVGRTFTVGGPIDDVRLHQAVLAAAQRHEPLSWTYGSPRRKLDASDAVRFEANGQPATATEITEQLGPWQQAPFDLEAGELLRCLVAPLDDGTTVVALAIHHVSGDHGSLDQLWIDIDHAYRGDPRAPLAVGYGDFCAWQESGSIKPSGRIEPFLHRRRLA